MNTSTFPSADRVVFSYSASVFPSDFLTLLKSSALMCSNEMDRNFVFASSNVFFELWPPINAAILADDFSLSSTTQEVKKAITSLRRSGVHNNTAINRTIPMIT